MFPQEASEHTSNMHDATSDQQLPVASLAPIGDRGSGLHVCKLNCFAAKLSCYSKESHSELRYPSWQYLSLFHSVCAASCISTDTQPIYLIAGAS